MALQPDFGKFTRTPVPVAQAGGALAHSVLAGCLGIQIIGRFQAQHTDVVAGPVFGLRPDGCGVCNLHYYDVEELRNPQHRQLGYFVGRTLYRLFSVAVSIDTGLG